MTTREAIALVRNMALHGMVTKLEREALLLVAASAEHNHARRTRRKRERRERASVKE